MRTPPAFTPPPDLDQRGPGFPRLVNGRIDIGAYEASEERPEHQTVLSQLEEIRAGITNKIDSVTLDETVRGLTGSFNLTNWIDDSHLRRPGGRRVFADDAIAVGLLTRLVAKNRSALDTVDLQVWVMTLVLADRSLVETAINQGSGDTGNAQAVFAKGDAALGSGNIRKAIRAYAIAWKLTAPNRR